MPKKALIISYYWPPGSGPGVQRWLKFCKYLPENDWEPLMVTVANGSYPSTDLSLENDIPIGMKVFKTKTLEPFTIYNALRGKKGKSVEVAMASVKGKQSNFAKFSNYVRSNFFIPDARVGWNRYAYNQAVKVIEQEKPDVIITTGPPHSTHLIGLKLKSKFNIPWVADFRDPWTTIYYNQFLLRTKNSDAKDLSFETSVLKTADAIITATPGITEDLRARSNRIETIPNGFDEADFEGIKSDQPPKFRMAYVGNLKPIQNTKTVWKAISELCSESQEFKNKFEFEITGNIADEIADALKDFGIMEQVVIKSFVPHKQAIARMLSAHVLFLPIPIDKDNTRILTGKIFEYLATKRPLLAVGPTNGNAASILTECGKAPMLEYDNLAEIKSQLRKVFSDFEASSIPKTEGNDNYQNYSRKGTTKMLASLINSICD
jgi:glycosyltransferase involved in cell wall biosynthesis